MHYSAKRGIATACRLSVCPSVCDVGGSGAHSWKYWKITAQQLAQHLRSFALRSPKATYSQENMGKFGGDYRGGWGKSGALAEHKSVNISETRKGRGKVTVESL